MGEPQEGRFFAGLPGTSALAPAPSPIVKPKKPRAQKPGRWVAPPEDPSLLLVLLKTPACRSVVFRSIRCGSTGRSTTPSVLCNVRIGGTRHSVRAGQATLVRSTHNKNLRLKKSKSESVSWDRSTRLSLAPTSTRVALRENLLAEELGDLHLCYVCEG